MRGRGDRTTDAILALVAAALAVLLYLPTLDDPWHFDDGAELAWPGVAAGAPRAPATSYRGAVVLWTWAWNYRLGGEDPRGYHGLNMLVHAACAALLFALARGLGAARPTATIAALLFAAHPLATQAVAYVTQRSTSLATLFLLATIVAWLAWRREAAGRGVRLVALAASLVAYAAGLHAKHVAFVAPLVILAIETGRGGPPRWRRRVAPLAPFGLLAALRLAELWPALVRRLLGSAAAGGALPDDSAALLARPVGPEPMDPIVFAASQPRVVLGYLRKLVWPTGLSVDPHVVPDLWPVDPGGIVAFLGLVALATTAWRLRRRAPLVWAGAALFFLALLPTSSVIPSPDLAFEHRAYAPLAGFALAAAAALAALGSRLARGMRRDPRLGIVTVAGPVIVALAFATEARLVVWDSELALWADAAAKAPGKARPRLNHALALRAAGRLDEAATGYEAVLRLDPASAFAVNDLGDVRLAQGRLDEAERLFRAALATAPRYLSPRANLGAVALARGDTTAAVAHWNEVLDRDPDHWIARYDLAKVALARGDREAAIAAYRALVARRPGMALAWNDLGAALLEAGRTGEAVAALREAVRRSGGGAAARWNLSLALEAAGDAAAARRELEAAVRADPRLAEPARGRRRALSGDAGGSAP